MSTDLGETFAPKQDEFDIRNYSDTMFPEGVETAQPRFAISWRNKWMIKQSDCVVTFITHSWGGAAQFAEMAANQKKQRSHSCSSLISDIHL